MLVIFDCDGVLVDSEHLAAQVFSDVLAQVGISMSKHDCLGAFCGKTLENCFQWLEEKWQVKLPIDFKVRLDEATKTAFSCELKPVDGVDNVLRQLSSKTIPICVASNGGYQKIINSLRTTKLLGYFPDACFSAEQVAKGKPAPDIYLHAADSMGVPPAYCFVVEDTSIGVKSAVAAGMHVLWYKPIANPVVQVNEDVDLGEKVKVFSRMDELVNLLAF